MTENLERLARSLNSGGKRVVELIGSNDICDHFGSNATSESIKAFCNKHKFYCKIEDKGPHITALLSNQPL